jgi:hypothetical protein
MHDAVSVHDDEPTILFEEAGPLPQIKARPGFAQRWVRVATKEGADGQNIARMAQRGWKPRPADTVPKALQFYTVQKEGLGGVVGTHDCVLMERREEVEARSAAMNKERRRELERAVKGNLFSETKGAVNHDSRSQVERGKRVHVADD